MTWLVFMPLWLATATAPPAVAAPTPAAEVRTVTLKNGLRLLLAPDPSATSVDLAVWYDSGPRVERAGATGISHLFEHLMFRGSDHYGPLQHLRLMQAEGGSTGAYTAEDYTSFYETMPPEALELAFRLEADRMTGLKLTEETLVAERRGVRDERRRQFESTPAGQAVRRLEASAFADHPYRWPLFGLEADVEKLTLEQCRAYYAANFGPSRAVVTVLGSFEPATAEGFARRYLEPLRATGPARVAIKPPAPQTRERREHGTVDARVPVFGVAWRGPARADADFALLYLLSIALSRGESSRLQRGLVSETPLCVSLQGDLDARRDASLLYVVAALAPGADTSKVEGEVLDQVARLASTPMNDDELERVKRQAEAGLVLGWQTSRGRALALGSGVMLAGNPRDAQTVLGRIRGCSAADLQRAAGTHLTAAHRTVLWLMPSAGPGTAPAGMEGK